MKKLYTFNFNQSDINKLDIAAKKQGMNRTALVEDLIRAHIAVSESGKFKVGEPQAQPDSEFIGLRISEKERDLLTRVAHIRDFLINEVGKKDDNR